MSDYILIYPQYWYSNMDLLTSSKDTSYTSSKDTSYILIYRQYILIYPQYWYSNMDLLKKLGADDVIDYSRDASSKDTSYTSSKDTSYILIYPQYWYSNMDLLYW